jgi:hypothetical protein
LFDVVEDVLMMNDSVRESIHFCVVVSTAFE